nr:Eco57I restriction-modification methylase domain-containing protein [Lactococcus carnosus]
MVNLLDIDYKVNFTLIEPAVGEGHILSLIVNRYLKENKNKTDEEKVEFLEKNIAGFDIRDEAIAICIEKLDYIAKQYVQKKIKWKIQKFDALEREDLSKKFGKYDYVISNPPYVSRHNMDDRTILALRNQSEFCVKFNYDLYYYFFEVGFDLWNRYGKIVYITPNSYMKARSGEILMEYIVDNSLVETIIDYEDEIKFEGATTYTAITVFSTDNKILRVKNKENKVIVKVTYKDLINKYNYRVYSHDFLTQYKKDFIDLGEISEIKNGLATLQDKVFIISEKEIINKKDNILTFVKDNKIFSIETEILRKVVRVSNVEEIKYVIFPYISESEEKISFIRDVTIKKHYNKAYQYLSEKLTREYQNKYDLYFGRSQGFTCYYGQKIVIPKVASLEDTPFKIVENGFLLSGLSIKLRGKYLGTDLNLILDYLNSDEVKNYLTVISKNYAAGYKSISSTDLKKIKIPKKNLKLKE